MDKSESPPAVSSSQSPTMEVTRAAEYVRMSTDHQQYSTENQREVIRKYSESRGKAIVRSYTDAGKSGLRIDGRDALKQIILTWKAARPISVTFSFTMSADGDAFRTLMKAPTTNTSAAAPRSTSTTVPSSLRMTAVRSRQSSKA